MAAERHRAELEALQDLLQHFGTPEWGPDRAADAFGEIAIRSRVLADSYVSAASATSSLVERGLSMPLACRRLIFAAHEHLYSGMLANAGRIRRPGGSGGSSVYFGGWRGDRRTMRFAGTPANRIERELDVAFGRLQDYRPGGSAGPDPARDEAVLFYADLSRIHPFYDANGRAGRFVVSVYLHLHGWLVEWGRIEKQEGEFMKRINNVNEKATARTDYPNLLLRFWRRHVVRTDDLDG